MMKLNMGNTDRMIRILIAVVIATLSFLEVISGTLQIVLLVVAVLMLLTSFMRFCPAYLPFGISTRKKD